MANFFGLMRKPKETSKDMSLYYDLKPGSSCDYHRVTLPLELSSAEFHPRSDIFVFNRIFTGGLQGMQDMKKQGIKIIVDWDDFIALEPDHYLFENFKQRNFTQLALEYLKLADVVTVTTEYLAAKLRPYHRNIVVIRNCLPFDTLQFTRSLDTGSSTPVIWAGGASHAKDLMLMTDTFSNNLLTIAGYEDVSKAAPGSYQEIAGKEWYKIAQAFQGASLCPAVKNLDNYMDVYNGHAFAVAPLVDNSFNSCKSNLKILEAGAKGIPIVCSKVLPYFNPIDEAFVSYASTKAEWEAEVNRYLNNPSYREDRGAALAEHVRLHYSMQDANELRRQVYESL